MDYINFASKISFFEFTQNEFKEQSFNCDEYEQEINLLKKQQINIENLSELLRTNPKIIDIFEELFQLNRFTNAQLIHFFLMLDCSIIAMKKQLFPISKSQYSTSRMARKTHSSSNTSRISPRKTATNLFIY